MTREQASNLVGEPLGQPPERMRLVGTPIARGQLRQRILPGAEFWSGKRVIVTGGAGFLGCHVVDRLRLLGCAEVIVPRSSEYDLRDITAIRRLLSDCRLGSEQEEHKRPADIVIHLAARVGGIGANRDQPAEFFYDNLLMGAQLLHECWRSGVSKFVAVGTVCAYPKHTPIPFKESDLWNGYPEETNAPYGLAKKMLLVQSQAYRKQYGYNSIFLLPVNLYGPRDNFDPASSHVIPALIKKCVDARDRGEPAVVVWGDGSPTREFLYVADAAEGICLAAQNYNGAAPVNLGSTSEIGIADLVGLIVKMTGYVGKVLWDTSKPNGQPRRKVDTSVAREFGFVARTNFEDGLRLAIEWYERSRTGDRSAERRV